MKERRADTVRGPMDSQATPSTPAARKTPPGVLSEVLGIIVVLGLTWWVYSTLTELETSGGTLRMPWFLAFAYELGGKWPIIGILLLAVASSAKNVFKAVKQKRG